MGSLQSTGAAIPPGLALDRDLESSVLGKREMLFSKRQFRNQKDQLVPRLSFLSDLLGAVCESIKGRSGAQDSS